MVTRTETTPTPTLTLPEANWRRTLSNALIITRREVRDSLRDWRILAPIVVLTFLFPFLATELAARFTGFVEDFGAEILAERTIPFLLMIIGFFPISISLVIALETFVGEKERRSLEPLLSTPLTNTELYIGKTLAAMIPPLLASYGGMGVYLFMLLSGELAWRPQLALVVQIVLLTTVQALVMVTGAVVVSSQTTSTRAANLLASFIIIPMALVIQGESFIMFMAPDAESPSGIGALWAVSLGMFIVVLLLLRVGNAIFNREELLGRTIDQMNLRGFLRRIRQQVWGVSPDDHPASGLIQWYRAGVLPAVGRLGLAIWLTLAVFVAAFIGGYVFGQNPEWQLPLPTTTELTEAASAFDQFVSLPTQAHAQTLIFYATNNLRVLLAATLLGLFTFGVGALVLTPLVYVIIGYFFSQIVIAGYNPMILVAAIVPHGIAEVPVILVATAAALRLGAAITRPPQGMTVGQAWTRALADTIKIFLGVVVPGLLVAAVLEAFVTPLAVRAVLGL